MLIFGRYIISGYVSTFLTPHICMLGYVCHLPNAVIMCIYFTGGVLPIVFQKQKAEADTAKMFKAQKIPEQNKYVPL